MKFAEKLCVIGDFTNKYISKRGVGTGSPVPIPVTNNFTNDFTDELTVPLSNDFSAKNTHFPTFPIFKTYSSITSPIIIHSNY